MTEQEWVNAAEKVLLGKTIIKCRYMTRAEQQDLMWDHRPLVIALHDGTLIYPSRDEEGNDGGSLYAWGTARLAGPDVFGVMR